MVGLANYFRLGLVSSPEWVDWVYWHVSGYSHYTFHGSLAGESS